MGWTSIIEINHDCIHEIEENKLRFVDELLERIRSQRKNITDWSNWGNYIVSFPRWDGALDRAWQRWKIRWGKGDE